MVEREGEVDEELVGSALGLVILLDDVVDVLRAQCERLLHGWYRLACGVLTVTAELTKSEKTKAAEVHNQARGALEVWSEIRTDDVVVPGPHVHVDGVEDGEEGKTPADAVDDDLLAAVEELVDDGSEEQEVNEGPVEAWSGGASRRNVMTRLRTR